MQSPTEPMWYGGFGNGRLVCWRVTGHADNAAGLPDRGKIKAPD